MTADWFYNSSFNVEPYYLKGGLSELVVSDIVKMENENEEYSSDKYEDKNLLSRVSRA